MTPTDIRDRNWNRLRGSLNARQFVVLAAWEMHGPGTTREVAARAGMDILSLRPRTTELQQAGLLRLIGLENREGIYRVATAEELRELRASVPGQDSGQLVLI